MHHPHAFKRSPRGTEKKEKHFVEGFGEKIRSAKTSPNQRPPLHLSLCHCRGVSQVHGPPKTLSRSRGWSSYTVACRATLPHLSARVKSWQPMSNSWSTSSQTDFVTLLVGEKQYEIARARFCIAIPIALSRPHFIRNGEKWPKNGFWPHHHFCPEGPVRHLVAAG